MLHRRRGGATFKYSETDLVEPIHSIASMRIHPAYGDGTTTDSLDRRPDSIWFLRTGDLKENRDLATY
jgi:hypothetical protein